jgi:hypothetical protein
MAVFQFGIGGREAVLKIRQSGKRQVLDIRRDDDFAGEESALHRLQASAWSASTMATSWAAAMRWWKLKACTRRLSGPHGSTRMVS